MFFLLTQYLQGVLDYSPLGAALRLLPISAVMMFVAPQTPKLVRRFGADRVGAAGLASVALGMVGIALFETDTSYLQLVLTMCVLSGGMALTMTPMTTQLMASVPRDRAGMGSATNDTTRELGGALGVAVLGSLLTSQYSSGMSSALSQIPEQAREVAEGSLGGMHGLIARGVLPADTPLLDVAKGAFVDGLTLAATVAAVVVVLAAIAVKHFLPSDRVDPMVTGDREPESQPVAGR
jgi:Na+/melibiose symporter-like transporter